MRHEEARRIHATFLLERAAVDIQLAHRVTSTMMNATMQRPPVAPNASPTA